MKYQIMLNIMMKLLSRRKVTAREIADRYGISIRSVYRYVEELNICGVPVDVARGRYGGITIADTFRLPSGYFTKEEYAAAITALEAMKGQLGDESVISALEKLESRRKEGDRDMYVSGNVIVDGGAWGDASRFSEKMKVCEQAVNEHKSLNIDYISRGGEHSKRTIDPYVLIFKQNVWYVYAYCHTKGDFRTFKVGRIKNAGFTGESFEKKEIKRQDIPLDFRRRESELIDVVFEITKENLPDAEEWLGIDNIEPRGKGFIAEASLPDDGALVGKILSYGGAVKVISPESLKKRVKEAAKKIADW